MTDDAEQYYSAWKDVKIKYFVLGMLTEPGERQFTNLLTGLSSLFEINHPTGTPSPYSSTVSSSSSALLYSVFIPCTQYIYTFTGYNYTLGHEHCATYSTFDFHAANLIRHIRSSYGLKSPCEGNILYVSCY